MKVIDQLSRRGFLSSLGLMSGGLLLSCDPITNAISLLSDEPIVVSDLNLFVQLQSDGMVNIVVCRSEMGQGIRTGLSAVIADELGADWNKIKVIQADGDKIYGNQNTDGSRSIRTRYKDMRMMGATAREMLISAAAKKWGISPSACRTENSLVISESGKEVAFHRLFEELKRMEVPTEVVLKDKKDFKYIGKKVKSVDIKDYVSGKAEYGIDVRLPDMKYAAISRCPVTFGVADSFDDQAAKKVEGVKEVFLMDRISRPLSALGGVVVVADTTWAAFQGKEALGIAWNRGENTVYSSDQYKKDLVESVRKPGIAKRQEGNLEKAFANAKTIVESVYETPHLVHAPMEVPNATAWFKPDGSLEIWAPSQSPQSARTEVAESLGMDEDEITIHVTLLGGGFGRKAKHDFIVEAALIARQVNYPVQVVWTREDEVQHGFYHTTSAQYFKGAIDNDNRISAWLHRTAFPSIKSTFVPGATDAGDWEIHQSTLMKHQVANVQVEDCPAPAHVRIGWMRSVNCIQHSFASNCFFDELALKAGKDPLAYHLEMLGEDRIFEGGNYPFNTGRMRNVLEEVKKLSGWGRELAPDRALGFAMEYSFYSYAAVVAEVSFVDNKIKVEKVFMAFDCGTIVSPDAVANQLEGSAVFGASIALFGEITMQDGAVEQSNFHDYKLTRMQDAPEVALHLVDSDEPPVGVGEPGVPPVAPAIYNAVAQATGKRYYSMPLKAHGLVY